MILDRILIVDRLSVDQLSEFLSAQMTIVFPEARRKCSAVVETKIAGVVRLFRQVYAFFSQNLLKQLKMNGFVVDDNPVEIEYYGSQHGVTITEKIFRFNSMWVKNYPMANDHHHTHHAHGHVEFRFCPRCGGDLDKRIVKENEPKRLVCHSCSFIFYQDPKVVAGTIFTLNGGIVLLKRSVEPALGKWVFPGGYVDRGEAVHDAAVRETKEESNLDVKLGDLLNVYSYPRSPNVIVVYTAEVISGSLQPADESDDARAFTPTEIPWDQLAFDSTRDALRDYIRLHLK